MSRLDDLNISYCRVTSVRDINHESERIKNEAAVARRVTLPEFTWRE